MEVFSRFAIGVQVFWGGSAYMVEALMLAHKPNGDCVYLGDGGCTRQADKPQQCHEMDCRRIAQAVTKAQATKLDARGARWLGAFDGGYRWGGGERC